MEQVLQTLFTLDKDEGYSVRIELCTNNEKELQKHGWCSQFMIQTEDLADENIGETVRKLKSFLNDYKKTPLTG